MVGYVVIDVQDNVLRYFAIDHVLVSFVTIATIQARFLAYNSPKTVWRDCCYFVCFFKILLSLMANKVVCDNNDAVTPAKVDVVLSGRQELRAIGKRHNGTAVTHALTGR